jgi:hypothetical protein
MRKIAALCSKNMNKSELLFTLVFDFRGGTYVSQSSAESVSAGITNCVAAWCSDISDEILDPSGKKAMLVSAGGEEPVLLQGLTNVWCTCFEVSGEMVYFNIVQTQW